MKNFLFLILVFSLPTVKAQGLKQKIENAYRTFESDPQMRYANSSLSVLNAETGAVIYSANGNTGLASASTLKTISSASAFYILGKEFTWETTLGYSGSISANGTLNGDIIITGGGDPALGSERFDQSRSDLIMNKWADALTRAGIKKYYRTNYC